MKQTKNRAFTLVELIVVITILAVLATVAFISFQGYTSSSRDSVRLSDLKNISKSFELMKTKDQELPLPDQKVDISNSGTIFQYQGVLEEQTLKLSNIHNGGLDPLDGAPYGYAVNAQRNKFQVIGFLENSQTAGNYVLSQTLANNTDKFVKTSGDSLGIILDNTSNEVLTQSGGVTAIELKNNTNAYKVAVSNRIEQSAQIEKTLAHRFNPIASCEAILLNGTSQGNGFYTINPTGLDGEEFQVYCDMKTQGGGWTRVAYNFGDSTANFNKDFMVSEVNVSFIGVDQANTVSSLNPENFSRLFDTQDAMLKSQAYSAEPIIEIDNGNWDYDEIDCQGPLGHTSRTQGCNNHVGNDNGLSTEDMFNIAYYSDSMRTNIAPYYLVDYNSELCWEGRGFCDFEFFLR